MPAAPPPKPDVAQEADDLADLDDVLDDFDAPTSSAAGAAASSPPTAPAPAPSSGSAPPAQPGMPNFDALLDGAEGDGDVDELLSGDFAKELAAGMEALMRELGGAGAGAGAGAAPPMGPVPPPAAGAEGDAQINEDEMMRQFEAMMKDMGLGGAAGAAGSEAGPSAAGATGAASSSGAAAPPANFQDAIKATMERLKNSDSSAAASAGGAGGFGDADLEKLMAALGGGAGGEGGDEDLAKMLENMMGELMSKEVLYEPLKELRDKYPPYLSSPAAAQLSNDDRVRYQEQARVVGQIVATFDERDYDHGSEARKRELKAKVQELMNEMQDNGAPPPEIAGEMPSELAGLPGMNGDDENCSVM